MTLSVRFSQERLKKEDCRLEKASFQNKKGPIAGPFAELFRRRTQRNFERDLLRFLEVTNVLRHSLCPKSGFQTLNKVSLGI